MGTGEYPERPTYHHSNLVNWPRLAIRLTVLAVLSSVLGLWLCIAFRLGCYQMIAVPLVAYVLLAMAVHRAIGKAHCRNPVVGVAVGVIAVVIMYLVSFYADMLAIEGAKNAARIDRLGSHALLRITSDEIGPWGIVLRGKPGGKVMERIAGSRFYFESIVILVGCAYAGLSRARRAYCEACQCWMQRLETATSTGVAEVVRVALLTGSLDRLAEYPEVPRNPSRFQTVITLERCCQRVSCPPQCCHWLTIAEQPAGRQGDETLLKQVGISDDEAESLFGAFPALRKTGAIAGTLPVPNEPVETVRTPRVMLEPAAPNQCSTVCSARTESCSVFLSLMPLGLLIAGILALAVGLFCLTGAMAGRELALARALIAGGLLAAGFGGWFVWMNIDYFNMRHLHRLTRNEVEIHAGSLFNPDREDAYFVELQPRDHWMSSFARAVDVGFLLIDLPRRQLLFEGTRQRARVDGDAITLCRVETMSALGESLAVYATVVRVNCGETAAASSKEVELCFVWRPTKLVKYRSALRRLKSEELCSRIRQIMPETVQLEEL